MPMYEYLCKECQTTTELLRAMDQADEPVACEACGSKKTQRQHSVFSTAADKSSIPLPMGGCGRCGDPQGACGM